MEVNSKTEKSILKSIAHHLGRAGEWVISSRVQYQNPVLSQKARLLSGFLLIQFLVYLGVDVFSGHAPNNPIFNLLGYILMILAFIFNRYVHYFLASRLAVLVVPYLIFWDLFTGSGPKPYLLLNFLLMGVVYGGFLVRKRGVFILGLINIAGITILYLTGANSDLDLPLAINSIATNILATLLLILYISHRDRVVENPAEASLSDLETIYKNSPLGILFASQGSTLVDVNQAACDLLGYTRDELIGMSIPDLTHKDDQKDAFGGFLKLAVNQIPSFSMETRFLTKSEETIWVNLNISLVFADTGIPSYGIGIIEDITQRKQDQLALEVSLGKLRGFLDQSNDGISITDSDFKIIEWSKGMEEITGIPAKSAVGEYVWDIQLQLTPQNNSSKIDQDQVKERYKELAGTYIENVHIPNTEVEIEQTPGVIQTLQVATFPINTDNGTIFGSIHRDITDRVKQDEEMRASEKRYRTLFEYSAAGISMHDGPKYISVNQTWLKMFGYSESEVIGKTPFDFSPEFQPDGVRSEAKGEKFLEEVSRGNDQVFEWRHLRSDDREFDVEVIMTVIEIAGKDVHISFLRDITERKQYEESLQLHVSELQVLHGVSAICLEKVDEDEVIANVTNLLGDWLYHDHFGIMLVNEEESHLKIHPSYKGLQDKDFDFEISIGEGITGKVAEINQSIRIDDVSCCPEYIGPAAPHASELCVPISVNGHVYGVINAESNHSGAFSESDERLLATIADQLALAIQKNRLIQQEKRRRLEAEASRNASSLLTTSLDLDEVLDTILVNLRNVIDSDQVSIHMFMDDHVQIVAGNGFEDKNELIGYTYSFSDPLLTEIVDSNQPLILDDITADSRYSDFGFSSPKAWMGIPLIEKGSIFGILAIDSQKPGRYDQADANIGQIFADNAAAAIVKARLFETERKRRLEAEIQQEISQSLTHAEDLFTASTIFLDKIKRYLNYDSAGIFMEENGHLRIVATEGFPEPEKLNGLRVSRDNQVYQTILETKSYLIVDDVTKHQGFEDYGVNADIKGWMGVPLIDKGNIYGYISFDSQEPKKFTKENGDLAQILVNQTSSVITKARLFEETQLGLKRMSALHEIDRIITSSVDLSFAVKKILQICSEQLGVDTLQVRMYDPNSLSFSAIASTGMIKNPYGLQRDLLETGMAERISLERKIIHIARMDRSDHLFDKEITEKYQSYLGVPLIAKGVVVGVLEIFNQAEIEPNKEWEEFLLTLSTQMAIALDNSQMFEKMQRSHLELSLAYDSTIEGWAQALEMRDMETEGHSRRVVDLTMDLSRLMGIPDLELVHIRRGALLHDIGKMAVPDAILQKEGQLTDQEWDIMRQHPVYSQEWLSSTEYLKPALDIPYCHHEKWDGTGYPQGLKGKEIPMSARIFGVVDVYDALRSDRPYRTAWSKEKTLKYISEQSGQHFDPEVVHTFLEMMNKEHPER